MKIKLLFILLMIFPFLTQAQEGEELFKVKCRACHTVDKKLVGPPLKGVTSKREKEWLYKFINSSQDMIASGDPDAVAMYNEYNNILMPDQGLSNEEIDQIFKFIDEESSKVAAQNPIKRPVLDKQTYYRNIRFDNYGFWIPFTVMVAALVIGLYYMTVAYDIMNDKPEINDF